MDLQQAQTEPRFRKGLGPIQVGRRNGEGFAQKIADTCLFVHLKLENCSLGAQLNRLSAVSHNDQRCQELPELRCRDGRSFQQTTPLSALSQFGVGGRGKAHGCASGRDDLKRVLLLLLVQVVLLGQLPVHSNSLARKESQVLSTAIPVSVEGRTMLA